MDVEEQAVKDVEKLGRLDNKRALVTMRAHRLLQ